MKKVAFCVDSDGCAMDTMTYKHQLFFGPLAADIFGIKNRDVFLEEWNRINLFSRTRGVNRFVGLVMGLEFAGQADIENLKQWVYTTKSLSNVSLEEEMTRNPSNDLQLALDWSNAVNQEIKAYQGTVSAFPYVKEGLKALKELGDVYIVSSANKEAVAIEWQEEGLSPYINALYCQDKGKKEDIICMLIQKGYTSESILMIGDSPGDLEAAQKNRVYYYPILVGKETESWQQLAGGLARKFAFQEYSRKIESEYIRRFWKHLDGGK